MNKIKLKIIFYYSLHLFFVFVSRAEKCFIEQKKDTGWKFSPISRASFCFELIPKHSQKKEIFTCDTEDNRNVNKYIIN